MKKLRPLLLLLITLGSIASSPAYSQVHRSPSHANNAASAINH